MKRPLNLNQHGGRLIGIPGAFVLLALILFIVGGLLPVAALQTIALVALGIGIVTALGALFLIGLEQVQDYWYDRSYRQGRGRKLPGGDGYFECQYCGNRRVSKDERTCPVCGQRLA